MTTKQAARTALILLAMTGIAAGQSTTAFFKTSNRDILGPDGAPFVIRGNAPNAWLTPESYALRLNAKWNRPIGSFSDIQLRIQQILTNTADAQVFWDTYRSNYFTAADAADWKSEGFNTVRLPINYRLLSPAGTPGVYDDAGFQLLSNVVSWCHDNNLYVIFDLHCAPGGQSADTPCDPEQTYWSWDSTAGNWFEHGVACLWESNATYYANTGRTPEFNQQRTIDIWTEIATRFKDEQQIIGYDLINEPYLPWGVNGPVLRALLTNITASIRTVDTNHIIFAEDNFYAGTFENMSPAWDSNLALIFHKYWRPTQVSEIQQYLDVSASNNIPVIMGESGENSSGWFYEFKNLLESNNVGWCWWGSKKVDAISSALSCKITTNYQYVIDNFRDSPIDAARAKQGLMEMADMMKTTNCVFDPGWYGSLLNSQYGTSPQPFASANIPGTAYAVNYDIGHQGIAYSDVRYKNEDNWDGAPWNTGWKYRNDGVDIYTNTDAQGNGFHVGYTEAGEWLKYTVNVQTTGNYRTSYRVATSGAQLQLLDGTNALTSPLTIANTGGYGSWKTQTNSNPATLSAGTHVLQLSVITGGVDIAWVGFAFIPPPTASAPGYNPNGGTFTNSVNVTLSSATAGSTIYYTTDGSDPSTSSSSIANNSTIALSQPYADSVRAFATASGYQDSVISVSASFSVVPTPPASAPGCSPNGGTFTNSVNVTLSSATAGATIYYTTDGSAPSTSSASVANNGTISLAQPYANSVRTLATASGYLDSAISTSAAFSVVAMPVASAPGYSPNGGTYTSAVNVTLSSATTGATIYYTTDGSAPATNSSSLTNNAVITLPQPYTNNVKSFAKASGYQNSAISTSTLFNIVGTPTASSPTYSPNGGIYTNTVGVTLSSLTAGSTIYYTTNGTAPTTNSLSATNNAVITLTKPYTNSVKSFAKASGYLNSAISTSALFTVVKTPLQIVNGALTGSGVQPNNWSNWNDTQHDPDTTTYRSSSNSWAFWYDGGIYQDVTNGFTNGQSVTFGWYAYTPSSDKLRSGTKYGIAQLEFYNSTNGLISTASTPQINQSSTANSWLNLQTTTTVPSGSARLRLVIRCNNFTSGSGRFMADDAYVQ